MKAFIFFTCLFTSTIVFAYESVESFNKNQSEIKVLVFLSSSCPCSKSHVEHLNQLQSTYKTVSLFGVVTDIFDEDNTKSINEYYKSQNFKFSMIKDDKQVLIKKYKALKTPHTSVLQKQSSGDFKLVYQGGVSNHRIFEKSDVYFLSDNLEQLSQGKPPKHAFGKSLGCYIRRL